MCDGDFDGLFSDPDYDDLEFRRYNPSVYGDDEVMQYYYGSGQYQQQVDGRQRTPQQIQADEQFHQEYLRWKEKKLQEEAKYGKNNSVRHHSVGEDVMYFILSLVVLAFWIFIIYTFFQSCGFL